MKIVSGSAPAKKVAQLVSILIPAYNADRWIADSIKSALDQTWPRKEIIVVDDGSSDDTLRLARRFESASLKVLSQENRGASAARNLALSHAQGSYIQWLDADNLLAPDKISRQLSNARAENKLLLLSSAWGSFFYRPDKTEFLPTALWADLTPLEWIYTKLNGNIFMIPESWLVSRELTEAARPWDERLSLDDDGEYFTRVIRHCERIRFIPEAQSFYRCGNSGSLSSVVKRPDKKLQSQFSSIRSQVGILLSMEESKRTRAACVKYLQDSFFYFYPDNMELVTKAQDMARNLGGELLLPRLGWKYAWIKELFGWKIAKNVCFSIPGIKTALKMNYCRLLDKFCV